MKTPEFWRHRGFISTALLPASFFYNAGRKIRRAMTRPATLPVPVICVGNITAGGAGKTPVALAIGNLLAGSGRSIMFLSRGYGGSIEMPTRVNPNQHSARDVGDEPLLLAELHPTIVSKNRLHGAQFAAAQGAGIIIMDDGLQNPTLAKTLSLVVVDGSSVFGNGRLLPAGPLREPVAEGLGRADAVIVIGNAELQLPTDKPVFHASLVPQNGTEFSGRRLLAFCGIATPKKFFATLERVGAIVLETVSFGDHHPYSEQEIQLLLDKARAMNALAVTTRKDAVRLAPEQRAQCCVLEVKLEFSDPAAFEKFLLHRAGL